MFVANPICVDCNDLTDYYLIVNLNMFYGRLLGTDNRTKFNLSIEFYKIIEKNQL